MKEIKLTVKQKEALNELNITNCQQLLDFYPYRYEILEYLPYEKWQKDSKIIVSCRVVSKPKISFYKGRNSVIYFDGETDEDIFKISIFNRPWLAKLTIGMDVSIVGKYEGNNRILAMQLTSQPLEELLGIHPVYSLKDKIREKTFCSLIDKALTANQNEIQNFIPEYLLQKYQYFTKYDALKQIHQPTNSQLLLNALNTLKYEEFMKFNLLMLARKHNNIVYDESYQKNFDTVKINDFIDHLPFNLTNDQRMVANEILMDLKSPKQMSRLLQGDVGSGKTIVAFIAMYASYLSGFQSALLAPTEILAKQHYENLKQFFKDYPIRIVLLTGSLKNSSQIRESIASGEADFIVGTHALFQNSVNYHNLGLVVTDEQHRFGVKQRTSLVQKGFYPDILMMSATPIPRTLATTLYGDIDVSSINHTPNRNKVIHTKLILQNSFISQIDEITRLLKDNQMYVICPAIEAGSPGRNVNDIYKNLSAYFKSYKVGLLHGALSPEEKEEVEEKFKKGEIQILVSTTVVEVGVDVKNANIMVIYDANRFGLSQLHQLRGRVGRGDKDGYCYLLTGSQESEAINKLKFLENNTNGFEIAYYDLQQRGPGDVLGYRQSGLPDFVLGNIIKDNNLLNNSRSDAAELIQHLSQYPFIEEYLKDKLDYDIIVS